MKLNVECYSSRKADERPVRFLLGGRQYLVETVLDQWYDPESVFYKVRADDGNPTFFGKRHRCLVGLGSWCRFGSLERNAEPSESRVRDSVELRFEVP